MLMDNHSPRGELGPADGLKDPTIRKVFEAAVHAVPAPSRCCLHPKPVSPREGVARILAMAAEQQFGTVRSRAVRAEPSLGWWRSSSWVDHRGTPRGHRDAQSDVRPRILPAPKKSDTSVPLLDWSCQPIWSLARPAPACQVAPWLLGCSRR